MMYWNDGSVGWAGWVVMILSMAAFWGLGRLGRGVPRPLDRQGAPSGTVDRARGSLAERFARGDIDEEDYRQRSEVLRQQRPRAN